MQLVIFHHFAPKQDEKQSHESRLDSISSRTTQHNLDGVPLPTRHQRVSAGVWTKEQESLSQKLFTHGAVCLPATT